MRSRAARLLWFVVVLIAACATPHQRPTMVTGDFAPLKTAIAARIREEMLGRRAAAVAIAVVDKNGPVWIETFDRGPLEGRVDADAPFRVGSLSKVMTALTTLRLRDAGQIDLDGDINAVVPWFSIQSRFPAAPITPRLLMNHHSGLPSNLLRGMYGSVPRALDEQARLLKDHHMARPPGATFLYSDIGYALLGAVDEAAAGAPFADLAHDHVFAPLGLTRTSFVPTRAVVPPVVDGVVVDENPPTTVPANGLVTTPRDLARFASLLVAEDPRVVEVMRAADDAAPPGDLDWRTGFGINKNAVWASDVGPVYWHSGQTLAFTAELVVCPAAGVGVVVMTNTREAGFLPNVIAWEALALAIETTTGTAVAHPPPPPVEGDDVFDDDELERFAGVYPTEYGTISLARSGDHLKGRAFDEVLELVPTPQKTFAPVIQAFGFVPVRPDLLTGIELSFDDVDGQQVLVSHHRGLRIARGVRVAPADAAAPLSPSWLARVGHWQNPEQGDDQITVDGADVFVDDGYLWIRAFVTHAPKPLLLPLSPIDDDEAVTAGVGRYLGETVRITRDADGRERLHLVGYALSR